MNGILKHRQVENYLDNYELKRIPLLVKGKRDLRELQLVLEILINK
jgi:hypothetical protein